MTLSTPDGRFVLVNTAFADLVGRTPGELLALSFQDITHPEDNPRSAALTEAAVVRGDRATTIDKRYLRPDGTPVHVRISSTLQRSASGAPLCYLTQVADLTELHRERTRSQAREDQARRVIASAADAYIGTDADGGVLEWNPAPCACSAGPAPQHSATTSPSC